MTTFYVQEYIAPVRCGVGITFETEALDGSAQVKSVIRGSDADLSGLVQKGDILYEVGCWTKRECACISLRCSVPKKSNLSALGRTRCVVCLSYHILPRQRM